MGLCFGSLCSTKDLYKNVPDVWYDSLDLLRADYDFGKPLGAGVYAQVFEIVNKHTKLKSAAKHFSKRTTISDGNEIHFAPEAKELLEEVAIMKLLAGQNHCLRLDGVLETPTEFYMLMELCQADLMRHVETGHNRDVMESDAAEWAHCLLTAVAHCHALKVMHRDIKPENVLVTSERRVVLGDFGSAVRFEQHDMRFTHERGSSFWSSPETWSNDYDYRADNWSCGLVILVLVDGMLTSGQIRELHALGLDAAFAHGVKYDGKKAHQLSKELTELLKGLLCRDPAKRLTAENALKLLWFKRRDASAVLPAARANAGAYVSSKQVERALHAALYALLDAHQRDMLRTALNRDHALHAREEDDATEEAKVPVNQRTQSEPATLPVLIVSTAKLVSALEELDLSEVLPVINASPPEALLHVTLGNPTRQVRRYQSSLTDVAGLDGSGHPLFGGARPKLNRGRSMDVTWPKRSSSLPPQSLLLKQPVQAT